MSAGFSIGGLVSGLDTSSLVSQLMQVERIPVRSMEAEQARIRQGIDAFTSITTRVTALRDAARGLDALSDFRGFVTAQSSNSAVTATASGAAAPGALSFTVDALATQHQLFGDDSFSAGTSLVGTGSFTVTVDGTDHVVTTNDATTLNDLATAINDLDIGVNASVVTKTTGDVRLMLTSADTGSDASFTTSSTAANVTSFTTVSTAGNAQITFGSGPSAVTVERSTNTVGDLIDGVTLTLNQTTTSAVTVTTARDLDGAFDAITEFVTELNSAITELDQARAYDPDTGGGPLSGNSTVREVLEGIRRVVSQPVENLTGTYSYASAVGLEIQSDGTFILNESKLRTALSTDFDAVADLFAQSASSTDSRVSFLDAKASTSAGTYAVQITQAASTAAVTPAAFGGGGAGSFDLTVNGTVVSVATVADDDTAAEVVTAINNALSSAGISTLVASVDAGTGGIALATTTYGSDSTFTVGANSHGITTGTYTGTDVVGTINGEAATGTGRILRSTAGDATGLRLTVTASQTEVDAAGGTLGLGNVTFSTGIAGSLNSLLEDYLDTNGALATAKDTLEDRVDIYQDRIDAFERRLELREEYLRRQFAAMESAISSLQQQASFFAAQLGQGQG